MTHFIRVKPTTFLAAAFVFILVGSPAQAQNTAATEYEVEEISDGLYTFRWGAYRSLFMVTDEGVIVTDPLSTDAAKIYRQEIEYITDQPVRYVVYSQSSWDRVSGAQIFKDEGAQIVAQEKCVSDLEISPHPDIVAPDITFSDNYKIAIGGRELDLYYYGPSISNCFIVMIPRPASALYIVKLVGPPSGWEQPWDPNLANYHLYNIVPYLKQVEALAAKENIKTVIGGFTAFGKDESGNRILLPPAGPVSAISERREFWQTLMAAVQVEMDKGIWSELVPESMDLSPFEHIRGYREDYFKIIVWRIAHYQYTGR